MTPRAAGSVSCLALLSVLAAGCTSADTGAGSAASEIPTPPVASAVPSPPDEAETEPSSPASPAAGEGDATTLSTLSGTDTRLTIDARFLDALRPIGATLSAVGGATQDSAGGQTTFVFPVTGGSATVGGSGAEAFTGTVEHRGGLQLSALGRNVTIDNLVLDGNDDQLTAEIAGRRVPLLPLSTADAQITSGDGQATIADDAVELSPDAVNELTKGLGVPALPSLTFGSLKVSLTGS